MIKSILDQLPRLEQLRETGVIRGEATGFKCLDALYSVKQGTYTFIYAEPTHGKSEIIFELCFNQIPFGKRSLICSPETGTVDEIIAELIHKHTGKKIFKSEHYCLTDTEFYNAIGFISEYFVIVDTDEKTYSIPQLFEYAEQWEQENKGKKIDIIVGEPYNELDHSEMEKFAGRQDLYIEDLVSKFRRLCRKNKKHFILSIHPSGASVPVTKNGVTYYPKPLPRQAAGGQALYRKAMTWITIWRPPVGLQDNDGIEYRDNEVHVFIDKAKPKGVSFKGMCVLYFDWSRNRYYEGWNTDMQYAFEHMPKVKQLMPITTEPETLPF